MKGLTTKVKMININILDKFVEVHAQLLKFMSFSVGIAPPKGAPSIQSTPKTSKVESRRESIAPPPNKSSLPKKNGSISASNTSLSSAAMVSNCCTLSL